MYTHLLVVPFISRTGGYPAFVASSRSFVQIIHLKREVVQTFAKNVVCVEFTLRRIIVQFDGVPAGFALQINHCPVR